MSTWVKACAADEIDEEDLIRWDYDGRTFALYNTAAGFFATDGLCTHEAQHLEDGIVIGQVIECPLHQGRFDIASGKALSAPVCVDLQTYPVKMEAGCLFVDIG